VDKYSNIVAGRLEQVHTCQNMHTSYIQQNCSGLYTYSCCSGSGCDRSLCGRFQTEEMDHLKQCTNFKFYKQLGKFVKETQQMCLTVCNEQCTTPKCPSGVTESRMVTNCWKMTSQCLQQHRMKTMQEAVHSDHHQMVKSIAENVGILVGSCHISSLMI
jgi:hypothetical protein